MSSAGRAHKLSSGMLVSGLPPKPRTPNHSSAAPPFTGERASSRPLSLPILRTSGPLLSPTGLITSSSAAPIGEKKGAGVTAAEREREIGFWFWVPKAWVAVTVFAFAVAIGVGLFVWVEVGRPQIFGTFAGAAAAVGAAGLWNWGRGRRELERYFRACPDSSVSLRSLPVGELVKLTGLVTCGNTPLDSSYQNVPRCAYTSIELHERKARNFSIASCTAPSWTLRYFERHVTDFYVSDLNSGTRVLVRAGNGAKVVCFIKPATTLHMSIKNKEQFPSFLRWLQNHNIPTDIPTDDLERRFEEGYIREGSTVSVLGTLKTHENLIMIDPPDEASSTGWQWMRCFLPMHVAGLILIGDETPLEELCHV